MSVQTLAGGRYRIEDVLGRGGMATVHLARDDELDRLVAVKVLADHLAGDQAFRDRFVREARLAAQLSHPNVVQVFDAGEDDDGSPYIVMEYVEGRSLADELSDEGRLDPERVVELGVQVCNGLAPAHAAGLVHRDIKPGNLLLREDGTVKIADFGIARAAETTRLTQMGSVLGTAAYLSPEQALGEEVTSAADIYSLGCVLYECLAGRTPYVFETLAELAVKHRQEAVEPVGELEPSVPEGLEAVVMRCLARKPEYRPPSAGALADELSGTRPEAVTHQLASAAANGASEARTVPLRRPRRRAAPVATRFRRPGLVALAAILLVAAAIVIAIVARPGGSHEPTTGKANPATSVSPPGQTGDPATDARNLANWLRSNAG